MTSIPSGAAALLQSDGSRKDGGTSESATTRKLLKAELSLEAYDALNRLISSTGKSTESLLEELILSRSGKQSLHPAPPVTKVRPSEKLHRIASPRTAITSNYSWYWSP